MNTVMANCGQNICLDGRLNLYMHISRSTFSPFLAPESQGGLWEPTPEEVQKSVRLVGINPESHLVPDQQQDDAGLYEQ